MGANNIAVKRMNCLLFFVLSSDGFCLQRQIYLDHQLCKVWLTWQCHCCLCYLQNSATWQFYCCFFCFVHFCPPADVQVVQIELCKVLLQSADHALQSADGVTAPTLFDSVWKSRPLPLPLCCSNWVQEPFAIIIPLQDSIVASLFENWADK